MDPLPLPAARAKATPYYLWRSDLASDSTMHATHDEHGAHAQLVEEEGYNSQLLLREREWRQWHAVQIEQANTRTRDIAKHAATVAAQMTGMSDEYNREMSTLLSLLQQYQSELAAERQLRMQVQGQLQSCHSQLLYLQGELPRLRQVASASHDHIDQLQREICAAKEVASNAGTAAGSGTAANTARADERIRPDDAAELAPPCMPKPSVPPTSPPTPPAVPSEHTEAEPLDDIEAQALPVEEDAHVIVIEAQAVPTDPLPAESTRKATTASLSVGSLVEAKYADNISEYSPGSSSVLKRYYPGVISAVHEDDTYAIDYDDGDTAAHAPARYVRVRRE